MSIKSLRHQESGLVSLIVAITFITILTLITTSFALLSRREARQALDRQLSTQAFYAAESGVNDAINKITSSGGLDDVEECDEVGDVGNPDLGNGLSYTCVLVNQQPTSLDYSSVGLETSTIVRIQSQSGTINTLQIGWQAEDNSQIFTNLANHELPEKPPAPKNGLDQTGIVRATIISGKPPFSRDNFINNTGTYFLYPKANSTPNQKGTATLTPGRANQGQFVDGQCNTATTTQFPRFCNAEINVSALGSNIVYVRLKSAYKASRVTVRALDGVGNQLSLTNSQAVIDATGKATDVLRRIQVRVPLNSNYYYPEFALETGDDICKLITVPVGQAVRNSCVYD